MARKRHYWMIEPTPDDEAVMADLHKLTGIVARVEIVRLALRWLDHSADQAVAWSKGWRPPTDGENGGGNGDNPA